MAFISLGLPDSQLGSAWPAMRLELGAPLSYAGIISMIIAGGAIVSSLLSSRAIRKMGTGLVTAVSVGMTAVALHRPGPFFGGGRRSLTAFIAS